MQAGSGTHCGATLRPASAGKKACMAISYEPPAARQRGEDRTAASSKTVDAGPLGGAVPDGRGRALGRALPAHFTVHNHR